MRRAAVLALVLLLGGVHSAAAQGVQFFPRFDFHLSAEHLSHDDPRFVWDANFGGEADIVDYGRGRITFETNYQVVLGEEFKQFDPNQGNYVLAGAASLRLRGVTVAGVFYHQSRHLADRFNRQVVDWNMVGSRVTGETTIGPWSLDGQADLRGTIRKFFVDYTWELDSRLHARRPLAARVAAIATGGVRVVGVDGTRNRGTQYGARGEGGFRFQGEGGAALDLYVTAERRIDPYPLESFTTHWVGAGFRLASP